MPLNPTARLALNRQDEGDLDWEVGLNAGFDNADARLFRVGTGSPVVGVETADYIGQQYFNDDPGPGGLIWWTAIAAGSPGTWIRSDLLTVTTQGDMIRGDAGGLPERLPLGSAGWMLASDGITVEWFDPATIQSALPRSYLIGFRTTTPSSDQQTLFIEAGEARNRADTQNLRLASDWIKDCNAVWLAGDTNGALIGNAVNLVADTWYLVFAIHRSDTNVTDIAVRLASDSPLDDPTADLPANYDSYRRIGFIRTNAGDTNIKDFAQTGSYSAWADPINEFPPSGLVDIPNTITPYTFDYAPPGGYVLTVRTRMLYNTQNTSRFVLLFEDGNDDAAPADDISDDNMLSFRTTNTLGSLPQTIVDVFTLSDPPGFRLRSSIATGCDLGVVTLGYIDNRGRYSYDAR